MRVLQSPDDLDETNQYFNGFHDGFIKKIELASRDEFGTSLPWESEEVFESNAETLAATNLMISGAFDLLLVIAHYNYDWPNQPNNREIHIRVPEPVVILPELANFISHDIYLLHFTWLTKSVAAVLHHHPDPEYIEKDNQRIQIRSMENAVEAVLFRAKKVEIEEK